MTAWPASPGRGPDASHDEVQRLSGTSIEPSLRRPTAPIHASTPIEGMRRREGVIGPVTARKVAAVGGAGGSGGATSTTLVPISWVRGGGGGRVGGAVGGDGGGGVWVSRDLTARQ